MKTSLLTIIFLLFTTCIYAGEWNSTDKILFRSFVVLQVIDYNQTLAIAYDDHHHELNPIMGRDPSDSTVMLYFVGSTVANYLVSDALSLKYRRAWLVACVLFQAVNVGRNYNMGFKIKFGKVL
jgi:hypothetical protein